MVVGGCSWLIVVVDYVVCGVFLVVGMYYFIVVDILFYYVEN